MPAAAAQFDLFAPPAALPEGFRYRPELIGAAEEAQLVAHFAGLDLREYDFHGYLGKRRVASFGIRYDDSSRALSTAGPIPDFLLPLRAASADFAELDPEELAHVLVTEYTPGAAIGWHRDRPVFGDIIGVSFASDCRFRFRRKRGDKWERAEQTLQPRSAYLMRGPAREAWQHSIPPADRLRYSVTFRSLRHPAA
jgi:alkylated DNA repair dioxygenase AlkB